MKLSNSRIDTFNQCGEKYRLHYEEKLREDAISSPLFFGSAFDAAVELLLIQKQANNPIDLDAAKALFVTKFTHTMLNGAPLAIEGCTKANYFKSDFDHRLLSQEEAEMLGFDTTADLELFIDEVRECKKKYAPINEEDDVTFSRAHWHSLKNKGFLMIDAYAREIIPHINKVVSTQKYVSLPNGDGDELIGYIDTILDWKDQGVVVFDNKTASKKYAPDSAKHSQQLTIYGEHENIYKVGYIVAVKTPKVNRGTKELYIDIQVIVDDLDPATQDKIFADIQAVGTKIKNQEFEKNWDSCFMFGRKCQYYNLCRTGSRNNLIVVDKDER
jgi:hypothetical protein